MSLSERLARTRGPQPAAVTAEPEQVEHVVSPLADIKRRVHQAVIDKLGPRLSDPNLTKKQIEERVREQLEALVRDEDTPITAADRKRLIAETADDILGHGPIEPFLRDPQITEIMVNGFNSVFVERSGKIERTLARFNDDAHLRRTMDRVVERVGRRLDESQPYVDARLPDGSRVNAAIPPVSIDGPVLTIRKFAQDPFTAADLTSFGTMTTAMANFLRATVQGRMNIIVSGGTGSGKTTTLNVLSSFIPPEERIITIEDSAELRLQQPHIVRMESRPPNIEGTGEVTIRDLVRNSLRMRPDRIVVGEVRGGEALDMLQAMNTGHDGSISTVHANTPRDVISRLETMCLMAGMDLPARAIREQIASAVQLIVHQARLKDGTRRITHVTEVTGMEGDVITLQDLFAFDFGMGTDPTGKFLGHAKSLGLRPTFTERLLDLGIPLDADVFNPEVFQRRNGR
jgi:pilus assembly protein CpaF